MAKIKHTDFKLNESDHKSPFVIPEGYLDNLSVNVMQKIKVGKAGSYSPVRKIISIVKPQLAFAAGFIAFVLILYSGISFILGKQHNLVSGNNTYSELIDYASYQLDENVLYEYLEVKAGISEETNNEDVSDLIIDYLIKENIDYTSLLKEL